MRNTCLIILMLLAISPALKSQDLQSIKDTLTKWIDFDGSYEKAFPLTLETAEKLRRDSGEHNLTYASFLSSFVGPLYELTGDYKKAEFYYKESMNISAGTAGDSSMYYAEACVNLGNMYNKTGLQYEGLTLIKKGYDIFSASPETPVYILAPTINNLAQVYQFLEQYAEAQKLYNKLLKMVETDTTQAPYLPILYSNIGTMYFNMGAYKKALIYFNKSDALYGKYYNKQTSQYIGIKSNIGVSKTYDDKIKESTTILASLDTALQNLRPQNPPLHIIILGKLAGALYADENYTQAQQILLRAIDTANKHQLTGHPFSKNNDLMLANLYIDDKNYADAESILLASVDSVKAINAHVYFGYLMALERLYSNTGKTEKAGIYMQRLNEAATEIYDNNFAFLSNNDRINLLPVLQYALYSEIDIMMQKPVISNAEKNALFTHCITMKARLLQDQRAILNKLHTSDDDSIQEIYAKWITNHRYLEGQHKVPEAQKSPFADSIQIETDAIESELISLLKMPPASFTQLQKISVREIEEKLNNNEAIVEFIKYRVPDAEKLIYKDEYIAIIVKKGDRTPVIKKLCSEKELAGLIPGVNVKTSNNSYLNKLYPDNRLRNKNLSYTGDKIYNLLLKPLMPYLKNVSTLYCSTDGLINIIALHALPMNTQQLVVDKFNIRYISSSAQLVNKKIKAVKLSSATVWGGINYNADNTTTNDKFETSWNFLPASKTEAISVNSLLENSNIHSLLYTGDTASKAKFDSLSGKAFDVLHIATHGYFTPLPKRKSIAFPFYFLMNAADESVMFNCGLVLAGANNYKDSDFSDMGYINAYEISAMNFSNAYLVTLSACETAMGINVDGEGVFGLSRAFALAGVKNVIVSLWQVPDKETTEFMVLFYKEWLQGISLEEAFESTQRKMKKKYPPYYWAAFKLIKTE